MPCLGTNVRTEWFVRFMWLFFFPCTAGVDSRVRTPSVPLAMPTLTPKLLLLGVPAAVLEIP